TPASDRGHKPKPAPGPRQPLDTRGHAAILPFPKLPRKELSAMASSISPRKRIRQNAKRRARNRWRTRSMKDAVKDFLGKVAHGSTDEAAAAYQAASKVIDRTAQKGVIHR